MVLKKYMNPKYIISKYGVFVGFRYFYNGMFILNINKVVNSYMSSSSKNDISLWQARLDHTL